MRRVSSRQRFALWDGFAAVSMESDGDEYSYEHEVMDDATLKRKRLEVRQTEKPQETARVIPAYEWEIDRSEGAPQTDFPLNMLNDDIAVSVLEFCDLRSIRDVMQVNHHYRDLITSEKAGLLWKHILCQKWNWLSPENMRFVDSLGLPTVVARDATTNFALLMTLAAAESPTCIDESRFAPTIWGHALRRMRNRPTDDNQLELETVAIDDGDRAVRFTGLVGMGDRCIRSDHPLPRPERINSNTISYLAVFAVAKEHDDKVEEDLPEWRPFVSPFVTKMEEGRPVVNLSPRLISYFEVSIMSAPVDETTSNAARVLHHGFFRFEQECTAVGLANEYFALHSRMPGWDSCSFGYHGDDGGIFHKTGHMLREYGPTFGAGDVIGCGVDYHKRAIFYTHNGKFLGYAFTSLTDHELEKDWYPVVGIDSKSFIKCNFGQTPFLFDLEIMMEESSSIVRKTIIGSLQ